jgi:hypothetical protein
MKRKGRYLLEIPAFAGITVRRVFRQPRKKLLK